jgi:photosystem I subunit 12
VSNHLFWVENIRKYFFTMEPNQTINLIALSLIVVIHAGVLALRLGISLGRN